MDIIFLEVTVSLVISSPHIVLSLQAEAAKVRQELEQQRDELSAELDKYKAQSEHCETVARESQAALASQNVVCSRLRLELERESSDHAKARALLEELVDVFLLFSI